MINILKTPKAEIRGRTQFFNFFFFVPITEC
jgi:hypothetical protein